MLGPKFDPAFPTAYDFPNFNAASPPVATLRIKDNGATNSLTYVDGAGPVPIVPANIKTHTILLRRLACPGLPANPTVGPGYNPYVTVDYMENVPASDAVKDDSNGTNADFKAMDKGLPVARASVGKSQPYAGHFTQWKTQAPSTVYTDQPQHTMFKHNMIEASGPPNAGGSQTLRVPFDWLAHLDRQLVSPMELLGVSGFKPHELTQQFVPTFTTTASQPINTPNPATITPAQMKSATGDVTSYFVPWSIQAGSVLVLEPGSSNEEVVTVISTTATTFTANIQRNHSSGSTIQQFSQTVPWYDPMRRLYRVFEFLETGSRAAGIGVGGRIPGKVNINTIWDKEILYALCDGQDKGATTTNPNWFSTQDVDTVFANLMSSRSPAQTAPITSLIGPTNPANPLPGWTTNHPFLSLATPFTPTPPAATADQQFPATTTWIDETLFRASTTGATPRMFDVPNPNAAGTNLQHAYLQRQLLSKIYNNLTTRSNVFAVWITVGFFQVTNDGVLPPTLGAEIGAAQNQNIQHRAFAIVDRTNLTIGPKATNLPTLTQAIPTSPPTPNVPPFLKQTVTLSATSGTTNPSAPSVPIQWQIQVGSTLVVDTGPNQETVVVTSVSGNQITADFVRFHPANTPVTIPGNPGPQPLFDARDPGYAPVIPYFAILK
jgi:hypothetical protein